MLTEAEKKWLEERQDKGDDNFTYCRYCNKRPSIMTGGLCAGTCPMDPGGFEYEDAAEFEARVAAKLAMAFCPNYCDNLDADDCAVSDCALYTKRSACRLKHARLAVEEEMEK